MRGTAGPEGGGQPPNRAQPLPGCTIDLRPFATIGALGSEEAVRSLLAEVVRSRRAHSRALLLEGALPHGSAPSGLEVIATDTDLANLAGTRTPSILLIARSDQWDAIDRLRSSASDGVTVRVLYVDPNADSDAIVLCPPSGERSLFVRPEFNRSNPPTDASAGDDARPSELLYDRPPTEPRVGIAVLGPVTVTGMDYPLERHPKLAELVAYLALHPEGATTANWTAALWPERRVPQQTVANRLSEARRIVGFASDGQPRLRRRGERHCLVEFSSDWGEFQELETEGGIAGMRRALTLVRGRPFDELAQGQWTVFEGHLAVIERSIASVALRLGQAALRDRDPELASWAAHQAIRAVPFDERLHRLLMRAADALGSRAGVESTLRQLALILEIEGDPLHGVHPRTAELYCELTAPGSTRA